jgi:hypothetical protein
MHLSLNQELAAQRIEELVREAKVARLSRRSPVRWRRQVGRRIRASSGAVVTVPEAPTARSQPGL